ncbi:hypothetical protein ON010_g7907 [Phytophthora cinnamomi]|nr:hypothetical protein ON010_g7907 [Phytophthora cinnamomi]
MKENAVVPVAKVPAGPSRGKSTPPRKAKEYRRCGVRDTRRTEDQPCGCVVVHSSTTVELSRGLSEHAPSRFHPTCSDAFAAVCKNERGGVDAVQTAQVTAMMLKSSGETIGRPGLVAAVGSEMEHGLRLVHGLGSEFSMHFKLATLQQQQLGGIGWRRNSGLRKWRM